MWKAVKRSVQAPMRLLGILNQIRILLEEQNDLLREIHLTTRGSHALTPKRHPTASITPMRKRTAADVWIRPTLTDELVAARDQAERESAASSALPENPIPNTTQAASINPPRPTAAPPSDPLAGRLT